jgi:ribonuclease P protein component
VSDLSFTKKDRLLDAGAYKRVFDSVDSKASHKHLLLLAAKNQLPHDRLGLVISKKNVKLAVQRNRIKRVVREFFRQQPVIQPGLDVVVLARKGMDQLDNAALSSILRQQWQQLTDRISPCDD